MVFSTITMPDNAAEGPVLLGEKITDHGKIGLARICVDERCFSIGRSRADEI
jgi:hypothetical protein